jgi:alginate O-acetyltransferase complex protein AlgI
MIFNSLAFAVFLPIVLIGYYLLSQKGQNRFLLLASLVFYAWWDWRFLSLLGATIAIDYYASHKVYESASATLKKRWMLVSVISNLLVLSIFKYSNFFVDSFAGLLGSMGLQAHLPVLQMVLPVGISFYTFMSMAYVIDVYRGELVPTNHFLDFALFVSYFPHLVAGPILRAPQLLPQLTKERHVTANQITEGISLIVIGYARKVVIADLIAPVVDEAFRNIPGMTSLDLVIRMWLFTIQLYGDFAGYSDIARGVSKLFGIELNLNFDTPLLSQNMTEFWRRWHISLSSWLRDYVYIPLGGNRKGKLRTYVNNFLTMLIGGLWHGANWTYVVWGALNGLYLGLHKGFLDLTEQRMPQQTHAWRWYTPLKIFFTFNLAAFAFLIFRSPTFLVAWHYVSRMAQGVGGLHVGTTLFVAPLVLLGLTIDVAQYTGVGYRWVRGAGLVPRAFAFGVLLAFVLIAGSDNSQPFIYFQF